MIAKKTTRDGTGKKSGQQKDKGKMMKKKKRFIILSIIAVLLLVGAVVFVRSTIGIALLKSKSHFIAQASDNRVLYEPGAEEYADKIAAFLPEAVKRVEEGHFKPFSKPFKVYVCYTQKGHNEFIANPTTYPIRGAAFLGDVFIAPSAFYFNQKDTHRESLIHELSHLHLSQSFGLFARGKIPSWFSEGLANCIAGKIGDGITNIEESEAVYAILNGKHLIPEEKGGLFRAFHKAFPGISAQMFHKQNKMFVEFIMTRHPSTFKPFMVELQEDKFSFAECFLSYFNTTVQGMWEQFKTSISTRQ
jgi:hypothetical protein